MTIRISSTNRKPFFQAICDGRVTVMTVIYISSLIGTHVFDYKKVMQLIVIDCHHPLMRGRSGFKPR